MYLCREETYQPSSQIDQRDYTVQMSCQPCLFDPSSGKLLLPTISPLERSTSNPLEPVEVRTDWRLGPASSPIAALFTRLESIKALGVNWDSYGSDAPQHPAVVTAHRLIWEVYMWSLNSRQCPALPYSVVPLSGGGIQVEWRGGHGAIEVEVSPDGALGYLLTRGTGLSPDIEEDNVPQFQIMELVRSIF